MNHNPVRELWVFVVLVFAAWIVVCGIAGAAANFFLGWL